MSVPAGTLWPGSPRPRALLVDALASTLAQPVPGIAAALVVAIVCLVVFATTGQSAAAEQAIVKSVDGTGTRLLTAVDTTGAAQMSSLAVADLGRIDTVEWSLGLGSATDVRNADALIGRPVALRIAFGDLPRIVHLTAGRAPRPGEALAGARAAARLGLADGVGNLTDGQQAWPVVGIYAAEGPLDTLQDDVLLAAPQVTGGNEVGGEGATGASEASIRYLYILARDVSAVDAMEQILPRVVPAVDPTQISVEAPAGAIALREMIAGQLGESGRQLMAMVLGVGLALITVTMFAAVSARRRDFGRRRTLGASRSAIVVLVLTQTATCAVVGACVGTGVGLAVVTAIAHRPPSATFALGVAVLSVLTALVGALPPALVAANRDPLRILRVP